jgi:DNA-binding response OmpR family regulator
MPTTFVGGSVSVAKILIADDDRDASDTLADLLRRERYDVRVVSDGQQAIEAVEAYLPGLALLDIKLPGLDGYETARLIRLKQKTRHRPVLVAYTGCTTPSDVEFAREMGFDHHLPKGIGGEVLCALIEALVTTGELSRDASPPRWRLGKISAANGS